MGNRVVKMHFICGNKKNAPNNVNLQMSNCRYSELSRVDPEFEPLEPLIFQIKDQDQNQA
jgi:hypothetical protein